MARSRLKIALALFSIALVLLGARLYSFYYSGPDAILQRAEAFGFRRMTVAQLGSRSAGFVVDNPNAPAPTSDCSSGGCSGCG